MAKLTVIISALAFTSGIFAQRPAVNDQTIATWTRNYEGGREEDSLTVHAGMLEIRMVGEHGSTFDYTVKLDNVRRFDKVMDKPKDTEFGITMGSHAIRITTRGDQDIVRNYKDGHTKYIPSGMWFASFDLDQQTLRDDAYKKLCALIGQAP